MNKTVQDPKMEIETIKKTQLKPLWKCKNPGEQTETTDASITNRTQQMDKRVSGFGDMIEEIDTLVNKNVKSKTIPGTKKKNPGNLGHYKKTKCQ